MNTISENLTKLSACISAAYSEISLKGGTLPAEQTATNLSAAVGSIQAGSSTKYGMSFDSMLQSPDADGNINTLTADPIVDLSFDGVKNIGQAAMVYKFYANKSIRSVTFPDLTALQRNACQYMFGECSNLSSVSFPRLSTLDYQQSMSHMFFLCRKLSSVSFDALTAITGTFVLSAPFDSCYALTSVSFPQLQTISGRGPFRAAFTTLTAMPSVTFPELTSITAGTLSNYATFADNDYIKDVYMPKVTSITNNFMFSDCNQLTAVHFATANEAAITATTGYATKWDAPSVCQVVFDL